MSVVPSLLRGLVALTLLLLSARAVAEPYPTSRPHGAVTPVEFGLALLDISSIDSANQSFTADVALVLRWRDAPRPRAPARPLVPHRLSRDFRRAHLVVARRLGPTCRPLRGAASACRPI
jgi:hypothetical protein